MQARGDGVLGEPLGHDTLQDVRLRLHHRVAAHRRRDAQQRQRNIQLLILRPASRRGSRREGMRRLWWLAGTTGTYVAGAAAESAPCLLTVDGPVHVVRRSRAHDASEVPLLSRLLDAVDVILADLLADGLFMQTLCRTQTAACIVLLFYCNRPVLWRADRQACVFEEAANAPRLTTVNPAPCTRSASTRWMLPFGHPARGGLLFPMGFSPANWTSSTASVPTAS